MNIYKLAHKFLEQFKLNSISKSLNSGAYNQLRYFQSNALAFKTVKIKNISVKNIAITANANNFFISLSQLVVSKFSQIMFDGSAAS